MARSKKRVCVGTVQVGRRTGRRNSMYKDILGIASQIRKSGAAWGI